jgi:uncharacterized protein
MVDIPAELLAPPRPVPTPTSAPFWDALHHDRIRIQRCGSCDAWVHYPRVRCPACLSDDIGWHAVSGRGRLLTWSVARRATAPMFADAVPQWLAIVELDEGVHLSTSLVDAATLTLHAGMPVEPVFDHTADGITLLRYQPVVPPSS